MRICGVDPGLHITGYGVIDVQGNRTQVVDAGISRTDRTALLDVRLCQLHSDLCAILHEHRPDLVVIEKVYSHYSHPQTAVLMGHARGVLLLAAGQHGALIREYAATEIKHALTGNGRATKAQVQRAIRMNLSLTVEPEPHDVADALAMALCGSLDAGRATAVGSPGAPAP